MRRDFFKQYTSNPPRAAFETTVGELKTWLARGRGIARNTDRQRVLGGIFDRFYLRQGLSVLGANMLPRATKVRIEAAQSPAAFHGPWDHVLVVRVLDSVCCLMCCAEWAPTGDDPLPLGRAA